jgi:hypothetical protein
MPSAWIVLGVAQAILRGTSTQLRSGPRDALVNASLSRNASYGAEVASIDPPSQPYRQRMTNFQNTQYYGDIVVGGQVLQGIFDTGSFELLVLSTRCASCYRTAYDYQKSPTYVPATNNPGKEFHFGSGPAYTVRGYDRVSIGHLTVERMPIWEIVDHKIDVLEVSHLDAIVGIGPGEADRTHPSLMDKFGITRFSVCLQQQDKSPGWIIWQDYDPRTRPGFTEVEVKGQVHWGVELWNVQVGDTVVSCQQGCGAVLDSGTSLIAAPRQSLVHLKGALDTLHPDCSNMHDMPWLRFQIADKIMELPPQAYIARMVGVIPPTIWDVLSFKPQAKVVMQCVPLLMDLDEMNTPLGPLWIIGMPFFRYYYTTFSFTTRRVHVAKSTPACEPSPNGVINGINGSVMIHQDSVHIEPLTIDPASLARPRNVDAAKF